MLVIYTTPSCSSCRKAKKWLDEYSVPYKEKSLFGHELNEGDIDLMLKNAENGFEDIISTRSKVLKEKGLDIDEMKISELKKFILDNPSVLKRPIMVEDERLRVGYNDEEIRVFIPKRLRQAIMCADECLIDPCLYEEELKKQFKNLKLKE